MFSMAFLLISIQCAASVDDNSAFSAKNVVEYHKCVKASMLKCFNGKNLETISLACNLQMLNNFDDFHDDLSRRSLYWKNR